MTAIRINLFGRLAVFVDNEPFTVGLLYTKPVELFTYLLFYRQYSHPREVLATLLWPELPSSHAKKNLRKVLCTLQHLLAGAVPTGDPPVLLVDHDWVALNPALDLQLDVAAFEHAYTLAQQDPGGGLDSATAQVITTAVALYEGELLAGLYADWCLCERERLENMYLELCHLLLVYAESHGAYQQAIAHGRAILRHDRTNERAHCDLMRLYYLNGDRSAAIHQYEHCAATLASDLGVKPSKCTEDLYNQICWDERRLAPSTPLNDEHAELQQVLGADPERYSHLQQIHADLQRMLQQVQVEIMYVERLLKS